MTLRIQSRAPKEIGLGIAPDPWARRELKETLRTIEADCTECGLCVKQCAFLQRYGTPKAIASSRDVGNIRGLMEAFECSLCGLCQAVCPFGVRPSELFLELRREAVLRGVENLAEHRRLLAYERKGTSRRYSLYALPDGCTTVFFPGCTFAGTRSEAVLAIQEHLQRSIPHLGVVLDCCTKPSHDLGRHAYFLAMFGEMKTYLMAQGVRTVLVACPNCYKVFRRYGAPIQVQTIYEVFAEGRGLPQAHLKGTVTIHDPCVMRDEGAVQEAVRTLVHTAGLEVEEMPGSRQRTLCCGEGGGVGFVAPELARQWGVERRTQAGKRPVVTYCAGCVGQLRRTMQAIHIMDLLLDGDAALGGRARVSRPPLTYWKRLRLKESLRRRYAGARLRERTDQAKDPDGGFSWRTSLLLVAVLAAVIFGVRAVGLSRYLEREILEAWIASYGVLAPLIYMLVYTVAPVLFLPGLPITMVGGVLFGPFWGVLYTITSATMGACLAFLVSRYVARNWVASKLISPRWRRLDEMSERQGWKVVLFTRLVPIFPFNLLNYAFGLTRVRFIHYAAATFVGTLPACVAYVVFSSSLLDFVHGRVSSKFVIGIGLLVAVSLVSAWWRHQSNLSSTKTEVATESTPYDLGRSLKAKAAILLVLGLIGILGYLLVNRYFYVLDSYVYTLEFHYNFWVNNLIKGDLDKFTSYLSAMHPFGQGAGWLCLAWVVQVFRLPFRGLLLVQATLQAYGAFVGGTLSFFGILISFWVSACVFWLFLGDFCPALGRCRSPAKGRSPRLWIPGAALAVPWLPVVLSGALFGLFRAPVKASLGVLAVGSLIRLLWIWWFFR